MYGTPYENLAIANICRRLKTTVWRETYSRIRKGPFTQTRRELERFFRSAWFGSYPSRPGAADLQVARRGVTLTAKEYHSQAYRLDRASTASWNSCPP
jgi:hypothetical protein